MNDYSKLHHPYGWSPCDQGYAEYFGGTPPMSYFNFGKLMDTFQDKVAPILGKVGNAATALSGAKKTNTSTTTTTSDPAAAAAAEAAAKKRKMIYIGVAIALVVILVIVLIVVLKKKKK
jgi:t-SNARE complex subunit (syntaxin)